MSFPASSKARLAYVRAPPAIGLSSPASLPFLGGGAVPNLRLDALSRRPERRLEARGPARHKARASMHEQPAYNRNTTGIQRDYNPTTTDPYATSMRTAGGQHEPWALAVTTGFSHCRLAIEQSDREAVWSPGDGFRTLEEFGRKRQTRACNAWEWYCRIASGTVTWDLDGGGRPSEQCRQTRRGLRPPIVYPWRPASR